MDLMMRCDHAVLTSIRHFDTKQPLGGSSLTSEKPALLNTGFILQENKSLTSCLFLCATKPF